MTKIDRISYGRCPGTESPSLTTRAICRTDSSIHAAFSVSYPCTHRAKVDLTASVKASPMAWVSAIAADAHRNRRITASGAAGILQRQESVELVASDESAADVHELESHGGRSEFAQSLQCRLDDSICHVAEGVRQRVGQGLEAVAKIPEQPLLNFVATDGAEKADADPDPWIGIVQSLDEGMDDAGVTETTQGLGCSGLMSPPSINSRMSRFDASLESISPWAGRRLHASARRSP